MGKSKKPHRGGKKRGGVMGVSQIPYAQRLALEQRHKINWTRERTARIVCYCWSVAANRSEGVGLTRLVRLNECFQRIDSEFYSQELEVSMEHARRRLAQMSINITGDVITAPRDKAQPRLEWQVDDNIAQAAQAAVICMCIAANDAFGWAGVPLERVRAGAEEILHRVVAEGTGFLMKELERLGFHVEGEVAQVILVKGKPMRADRVLGATAGDS